MNVFDLARMRHLGLLAPWHERNPGSRGSRDGDRLAAASKERLVTALPGSTR